MRNVTEVAAKPNCFEEEYFADGAGPTFVTYRDAKMVLIIYHGLELPETVRHAALPGATLVLAPTALVDEWQLIAERLVSTRATGSNACIAYANYVGAAGDRSGEAKKFAGGRCITARDGQEHAVASAPDQLITAEIDTSAAI